MPKKRRSSRSLRPPKRQRKLSRWRRSKQKRTRAQRN